MRFAPGFLARLQALDLRLRGARERRVGFGRAALVGPGAEFIGYRAWRPGEDVRQLDWNVYARTHRPFVRLARREASERWCVLLDTSLSMAVGRPGKLQAAAEIAAGIGAAALVHGETLELFTSASAQRFLVARKTDLGGLLAFLQDLEAQGPRGLAALAHEGSRVRGAGRVIALGDLFDCEPRDLLVLGARSRELACLQILAREELAPPRVDALEWIDPETGERELVTLSSRARNDYERLVADRLDRWGKICATHRASFACWRSDVAFEDVVRGLLGF